MDSVSPLPPPPCFADRASVCQERRREKEEKRREEVFVLPLPGTFRSCSPSIIVSASVVLPHLIASPSSLASLSVGLPSHFCCFLCSLCSLTSDCPHCCSAAPGFSIRLLRIPSCFVVFHSAFSVPFLLLPLPLFLLYPFWSPPPSFVHKIFLARQLFRFHVSPHQQYIDRKNNHQLKAQSGSRHGWPSNPPLPNLSPFLLIVSPPFNFATISVLNYPIPCILDHIKITCQFRRPVFRLLPLFPPSPLPPFPFLVNFPSFYTWPPWGPVFPV